MCCSPYRTTSVVTDKCTSASCNREAECGGHCAKCIEILDDAQAEQVAERELRAERNQ